MKIGVFLLQNLLDIFLRSILEHLTVYLFSVWWSVDRIIMEVRPGQFPYHPLISPLSWRIDNYESRIMSCGWISSTFMEVCPRGSRHGRSRRFTRSTLVH